jgi:hypothetical protein
MKTALLILIAALFCPPAIAGVTIDVNDLGKGWVALEYSTTSPIAGAGLNVEVSQGVIVDIRLPGFDGNEPNGGGFGIFPPSFARIIDPNDPNWADSGYAPVGDSNGVTGIGTLGGLDTDNITLELGAFGDPTALTGTFIEILVSRSCIMTVSANAMRGGIVLVGGASGGFSSTSGPVVVEPVRSESVICWYYSTRCFGDFDDDGTVNIKDFFSQGDTWLKTYLEAGYDPCMDFNRDGMVDYNDFLIFIDNWLNDQTTECENDAPWPPF